MAVKLLIQARSQTEAGSPIQSGVFRSLVLIEAGSLIQAGSRLGASGLDTGSLRFDKMKLKRVSCFKSRTPYIHQKNVMWQVVDVLIQARSLIQAGGSRAFVIIEAGGLYCIRSFIYSIFVCYCISCLLPTL